jgi:heterodisulfide reductase subunit B
VSQLVGLAIGLAPQHLALSRNVVGCDAVLSHMESGDATKLSMGPFH